MLCLVILEVKFSWDITTANRTREWFSSVLITSKAYVADTYLSFASISTSDYMLLIELSIGISFIIGTAGVVVDRTNAGVCVSIGVSASITR
jgi:hypothetical protein